MQTLNGVGSDAFGLSLSESPFDIELIDVKCDRNLKGMAVTVQFSQTFNGVIYSRGYFNDPRCRYIFPLFLNCYVEIVISLYFLFSYVPVGQGLNSYTFIVPFRGCGSKRSCAACNSIDNVLVIQADEDVQSISDTARKVSCSRTGVEEENRIFFKPFVVDMLEVVTVPTSNGGVDCWMDIQRGIYPKINPIGETIKIGEELSVLVYLRDPNNNYDLMVRNCYAYDNEDFESRDAAKLQLSDASGCSM